MLIATSAATKNKMSLFLNLTRTKGRSETTPTIIPLVSIR